MSSRSTCSPAFAQWAAIAAPIVPAPSTATLLMLRVIPLPLLAVDLFLQGFYSPLYPEEVLLHVRLYLGVLLLAAGRDPVEPPALGLGTLPLADDVSPLLQTPEQRIDGVGRDAHHAAREVPYPTHEGVAVERLLTHEVQDQERENGPRP